MGKLFDFELVFKQIPSILKYLPVTLELAVVSMLMGLTIGLIVAIIKIKKILVLAKLCDIYISILRGTPMLVQLYVVYFGIPLFLKYLNLTYDTHYNIKGIPPILCAFVALGINESAYNAETIRAALQSVDRGQIEAANAIGMTYFQTLRRIIIPEAVAVAIPSLGNSFISLVKGTSLAFTCAIVEMTAQGKILAGRNYRYFEIYISLALIYWVLTIIIEQILKFIEKKTKIPDDAPEIPQKLKLNGSV